MQYFRAYLITDFKHQCLVFKHWTLVLKKKHVFGRVFVFSVVWTMLLKIWFLNNAFWNHLGPIFKQQTTLSSGSTVNTFKPVGPTWCDKPSLSSLLLIRPVIALIFNTPNPQSINFHRSTTLTHQQQSINFHPSATLTDPSHKTQWNFLSHNESKLRSHHWPISAITHQPISGFLQKLSPSQRINKRSQTHLNPWSKIGFFAQLPLIKIPNRRWPNLRPSSCTNFTPPTATPWWHGFGFLLSRKRREKEGTMMRKEGQQDKMDLFSLLK